MTSFTVRATPARYAVGFRPRLDVKATRGRIEGLRYLLARYGADDTIGIWELFNEMDEAYRLAGIEDDQARRLAAGWIDHMSTMFRLSTATSALPR